MAITRIRALGVSVSGYARTLKLYPDAAHATPALARPHPSTTFAANLGRPQPDGAAQTYRLDAVRTSLVRVQR